LNYTALKYELGNEIFFFVLLRPVFEVSTPWVSYSCYCDIKHLDQETLNAECPSDVSLSTLCSVTMHEYALLL